MTDHKELVREFWNDRAKCGETAGSNDFMLKQLEEKVILDRVPAGARVLDVGCGNGSTLVRLAKEKSCTGLGLDYADALLELALRAADEQGVRDKLVFMKRNVLELGDDLGQFDHIMTQRCLINLETAEEQCRAFAGIVRLMKPGACYYMIEAFHDGNRALNTLRDILHLEPMVAPWHNRFFEMAEVLDWEKSHPVTVREVSHFASTYYFLSRVVYAKCASDRGEPLHYDSDINRLSLQLPPMGEFGATKLIVWRRNASQSQGGRTHGKQ